MNLLIVKLNVNNKDILIKIKFMEYVLKDYILLVKEN